jgi:Domain of unknown function (DUF4382)/Carboxypeptidase regulatory-like domain
MNRPFAAACAVLGAMVIACYQDDVLRPAGVAPTRVLLTDDPFPFDSVASVNVFVTRIEANSQFDTTGAGDWVEIAAPDASFDLLTLQQGATAFVGEGTLDAGRYAAIRMTIDVDQSSIKYLDGSDAVVRWPYPGQGEIPLYAQVEQPLAISSTGSEIVIDFDIGRSFLYKPFGTREFVLVPRLRAVNSIATGAIAGVITAPDTGAVQTAPVRNANITAYWGYAGSLASGDVAATGRTDAQGQYKIAFLGAGTYTVRVEQPDMPWLGAVTTPDVAVAAGATTPLSIELPPAGAGGTFLHITGQTNVYVGGTIVLRAAVGDSTGAPVPNPTISWFSRDSLTAITLDSSYADTLTFVLGVREGSTWIVATSGNLADSLPIQVISPPSPNPVASVTVTPPSLSLLVGDSTFLQATLRDSAGNALSNRPISWYPADSSGIVDLLLSIGPTAVLKARHAGSTIIRAVSEGKTGSATVTVQ